MIITFKLLAQLKKLKMDTPDESNVGVIASDKIQFNAEDKKNDKDIKKLTSKRLV